MVYKQKEQRMYLKYFKHFDYKKMLWQRKTGLATFTKLRLNTGNPIKCKLHTTSQITSCLQIPYPVLNRTFHHMDFCSPVVP